MRRLLITIFINLFIFSVSSFNVHEENEERSRKAFGPVTDLMRLGDYKIDYSQVNPQLHKLLVTKRNSFFNLLRYHIRYRYINYKSVMGIQPTTILHTFQAITDNLFLQEHLMLKERKKNPHCGLIAFRSYYIYQVLILYIIYVFILNKIKNKM